MKTELYSLDDKGKLNNLDELASIIKNGGLVAIPTETVYGLAANGLDGSAVRKIFEAKNRPMDNPLILHIADIDQVEELVSNFKQEYKEILENIWPGPLTAIFKKSEIVPDEISAGLDSVAIRMPDKDVTRELIRLVGRPLAAPSANLSTKPSPTSAQAVLEDMDGRIDAIIDGGPCDIGIESTVLDLTGEVAKILRPGFYTEEMLEKYFDKVEMDVAISDQKQIPKSPGQKYRHYSPKAKVIGVISEDIDSFKNFVEEIKSTDQKIALMVFEDYYKELNCENIINMGPKEDLSKMAKILFESFRLMDEKRVDIIIVEGVEEEGFGLSIMNRLKKAASGDIRRI